MTSTENKPRIQLVINKEPLVTIEDHAFRGSHPTWENFFDEAHDDILHAAKMSREYCAERGLQMYPPPELVFRAFQLTPITGVRVVIVGQDPYPTKYVNSRGQEVPTATGLSFSVNRDCNIPASLRNIYKELARSIEGFQTPTHGDLTKWAEQGVLMLNMGLTVAEQQADSLVGCWMSLLDKLVVRINDYNPECIYVLWGNKAMGIKKIFSKHAITKVIILESPHPAASCYGNHKSFIGNDHFVRINEILRDRGERTIDWQV